jgi:hypothetical protein
MNTPRPRHFALLTILTVSAIVLFGRSVLLPQARAQGNDPRVLFVHDNGNNRYIKNLGGGKWAEYRNGQLNRTFKEVNRTNDYIEIYTEMPQPTTTRLYNKGVKWMTVGDRDWRQGDTGGWKDVSFIP